MDYQRVLEEVERQIERVESFRESMMYATYESIKQIDLGQSAYEEMVRQMELINCVREDARRQLELMMPAVNMILEYARLKNAKSVDPNTSDFCSEWDWKLHSQTNYYWYWIGTLPKKSISGTILKSCVRWTMNACT